MSICCSACGSRDTVLVRRGLATAMGGPLLKIAVRLAPIFHPFSSKPLMGRFMVVCRCCGAKRPIFIN
ncbi:MAG: hypothetical protein LBI10_12755 [Deltaproteobacteria bacterium]|jgi:hypothetical protein|nr:hypothetical protein [Deltaproteobacteria bacterium]